MPEASDSTSDSLAARAAGGSEWLFIHLANVFSWSLVYLGSVGLATALPAVGGWLGPGVAEGVEGILALYRGWLAWGSSALAAYAAVGWIPLRRSRPGRFLLRAQPVYLAFAFLFRRLSLRRARPAKGTYWRHRFVRDRWLLILIKIHFLPIAVGSLTNTFVNLGRVLRSAAEQPSLAVTLGFVLVGLRVLVDAVDAVVSSLAYSIEGARRGSRIRAVDTNWLGWLACLVCYPPGWLLTSSLLAKRVDEGTLLFGMGTGPAMICAILGVACYAVYGCTAINLGLRYSNLSYRGVMTRGLYRWVRHPQYCAKIGGWFFEWLPFFALPTNILSYLGYAAIYAARIVTEERFLSRFADYRAYRERVKWRCIPGVW